MFSRFASSLPIAILSLAFSASAGAAHGGNCTDVPLRFTLHESATLMNLDGTVVTDSSGAPVTVPSAVVGDSGGDVYTTGASIKYCSGTYDAVLNLLVSKRKFTLILPQPISGTGANSLTPPPANYTVNGVVNVRNIICQGCPNPAQPFVTRGGVELSAMYNGSGYGLRFLPIVTSISPLQFAPDLDNDSTKVNTANSPYPTSLVYVAPQPYDCVTSYPSWIVRGTLVNQTSQPNYVQVGTLVDTGKNGSDTTSVGQFSAPFEYRIETLSCAAKPY